MEWWDELETWERAAVLAISIVPVVMILFVVFWPVLEVMI